MLVLTAAGLLTALLLAGCRPQEAIEKYQAPKPDLSEKAPPAAAEMGREERQQMLVAMCLVDNSAWFFKLAGSPERVGKQAANFNTFLESTTFSGADKTPAWQAPTGWTPGRAGGIRFATLVVDGEQPPLELAVTRLEKTIADDDEYVLSNMNRWRSQLHLPEFANIAAARQATTTLAAHGQTFLVANFVGTSTSGGGMNLGPFAGGGANHPPIPEGGFTAPPAAERTSALKFTLPEGWREVPASPPFSFAKFLVERDGKRLEISVSTAGGTLLDNVNRWRDQLGLPPTDEEHLAQEVTAIDVGATKGQLVELVGTAPEPGRDAILGVIAPQGGQTWFVKLRGNVELAQAEKPRFEAFVKSLQLP